MSSSSYLCGRGQRCVCALCVCLGPSLNFLPRLWPALSVWQQVRQWSQQHSYSASWSEEVGNGASPLPTSGQAVVRVGWGWGGVSDTFMNYHHFNKYTEFADAHATSSFRSMFFLWIDLYSFTSPRMFTHIQWPCCDQVRSLFCLIRLDLSVSLRDMTWNYTPSCSCAHARLEVGGQSTVKPQSGDPTKHSTFSRFPFMDIVKETQGERCVSLQASV